MWAYFIDYLLEYSWFFGSRPLEVTDLQFQGPLEATEKYSWKLKDKSLAQIVVG